MPVTPSDPRYDVQLVTQDGRNLFLRELVKSPSWEESLDEAAQRLKIGLLDPTDGELKGLLRGSLRVYLLGTPFGGTEAGVLLQAVPWGVPGALSGAPTLDVTCHDDMIYAAKSEDDYYYEAGQTATAIIRASAQAAGIPLGTMADSGVALSRQVQRGASLWRLWSDALKETAKKGGGLYRPRFKDGLLELVELGTNSPVWLLEIGANVLNGAQENWSRDPVVSAVKVVGQSSTDETERPVLALHEDAGLKTAHGKVQRVLSDPDVTTSGAAVELARQTVRGPEESLSLPAPDINTLRAGDAVAVRYPDDTDRTWIVDSVEHQGARGPGKMQLTLTTLQEIRWRWTQP